MRWRVCAWRGCGVVCWVEGVGESVQAEETCVYM